MRTRLGYAQSDLGFVQIRLGCMQSPLGGCGLRHDPADFSSGQNNPISGENEAISGANNCISDPNNCVSAFTKRLWRIRESLWPSAETTGRPGDALRSCQKRPGLPRSGLGVPRKALSVSRNGLGRRGMGSVSAKRVCRFRGHRSASAKASGLSAKTSRRSAETSREPRKGQNGAKFSLRFRRNRKTELRKLLPSLAFQTSYP
jgi:hypothetical protein